MVSEALLTRIRAEFEEMPGLKLTVAQATRLWSVNEQICRDAIDALVAERFLYRTPSGAVVALPRPRARFARAQLVEVA